MASFLIITFLRLRDDGTHHANYGSLSILFVFLNPNIYMGLVYSISLIVMYDVLPESHFTLSCHPLVVNNLLFTPVLV